MTIESINPATEDVLARFEEQPWAHVDEALGRAFASRKNWQTYGLPQRSSFIGRLAARLRQEKACYAGLVTAEMGKPIVEAEAEIEKCAVETAAAESYISFQPIGVFRSEARSIQVTGEFGLTEFTNVQAVSIERSR